jgi:hypothetical protein
MCWALIPLLYLDFGITSFKAYVAMPLGDHHVESIYPPLIVLSGALLAAALNRKHGGIVVPVEVIDSTVTTASSQRSLVIRPDSQGLPVCIPAQP